MPAGAHSDNWNTHHLKLPCIRSSNILKQMTLSWQPCFESDTLVLILRKWMWTLWRFGPGEAERPKETRNCIICCGSSAVSDHFVLILLIMLGRTGMPKFLSDNYPMKAPYSTKHNPTQVKRPSCNAATAHSSRFWFLNQNALELARTQTGTSAHANWNYPLHAGAKASRSGWGLDFGWRQNEILLLKHLI